MLRLENISKSFSRVRALQDVSIEFIGGQVHAVCGENGAGKSTLMNIIAGNLAPDSGKIFWQGEQLLLENIQHAQLLGISIVYQERSLVDSLSVSENIFPVDKPVNKLGLIDYPALNRQASALLSYLQLKNISPQTIVGRLSAAQKQMVEIAKSLARNPSLLILDEPTASVTHEETETLFQIVRQLKAKGVAVIYISHRMREIKEIADVVTILRDGSVQGTFTAQTPTDELVRKMVGRELFAVTHESDKQSEVALEVKNLSGEGFSNISFQLYKGEILGVAGLSGSGRTALARALFGDTQIKEGQLLKNAKTLRFNDPADAINARIAYVPDDRKLLGLFTDNTMVENIASAKLGSGFYDAAVHSQTSEKYKLQLGIKTPSVTEVMRKLSGGNQQKVVLAKWLNTHPDVFIINEPTHGVDMGAKAEIYAILKSLTKEGKSIVMISSELPELILLADRIAVMYGGTFSAIIDKQLASEEKLTSLASGLNE